MVIHFDQLLFLLLGPFGIFILQYIQPSRHTFLLHLYKLASRSQLGAEDASLIRGSCYFISLGLKSDILGSDLLSQLMVQFLKPTEAIFEPLLELTYLSGSVLNLEF